MNLLSKTFLLIFLSTLFSTIINVPGDYPTIQGALDAAQDGDIIEVASGTYTENIVIESEVTLRSSSGSGTTTIDGSGQTGVMSSTITVRPPSGSATIPQNIEIDGFTITGGIGNEMKKQETMPNGSTQTTIERKGGGIMAYNASPKVNNNNINANGNAQTSNGGGIIAIDSTEDWSFNDREYEINPELPPTTEPLDLSENVFLNNQSGYAKSVYVEGYDNLTTNLSGGYFDCSSSEYQAVSEYWVSGDETEFNFSNIDGEYDAISSYDVYVDPVNGIDQFNDDWNGDESHPFKTIGFALSMIYATVESPVTIYLFEGTYSPSENGEIYPINLPAYINLIGRAETAEGVILDAEGSAYTVLWGHMYNNNPYSLIISNMTFTGAGIPENTWGNGYSAVYFGRSHTNWDDYIYLDRLIIHNNQDIGLFLYVVNTLVSNVTIINNQGRGLNSRSSNTYVYNSIIWNNILATWSNTASDGNNIWSEYSNVIIDNSIIDVRYDQGFSGWCGELWECSLSQPPCDDNWENFCSYADSAQDCLIENEQFSMFEFLFPEGICYWEGDDWCTSGEELLSCGDTDEACCPISWLGDGYCDDGSSSCDMSCYWFDGGDCADGSDDGNPNAQGECLTTEQYMTFGGNVDYGNCFDLTHEECWGEGPGFVGEYWYCEWVSNYSDPLTYGNNAIEDDPLFSPGSYRLRQDSPGIDTGTNIMEYPNGYIEIPEDMYVDGNGDGISAPDMGAIEYIPEGSEDSYDINSDGLANIQDVVLLVYMVLGYSEAIPSADINADGAINVIDVVALVTYILS